MRLGFIISLLLYAGVACADDGLLSAIERARTACGGISSEFADMKTRAGINTAVTGVGTVAGGVALGTGLAKANVDKELASMVEALIEKKKGIQISTLPVNVTEFKQKISALARSGEQTEGLQTDLQKINQLEQKSKNLGNWRTGTMAGAAVTNIAGAAIASTNKVQGDLKSQIDECVASVKQLSGVAMQARMDNSADSYTLQIADNIVSACSDYEMVDLSKIDNRSKGAMLSSTIGAITGIAGTITSASANSQKVRDGDATKEKNLNTASNVLAGTTTVASATATIFNAAQIKAIKYAANVADVCEEALK